MRQVIEERSGYSIDIVLLVDRPRRRTALARAVDLLDASGLTGESWEVGGEGGAPAGWLVEVDGPSHFLEHPSNRPRGSTLLKRRHLQALGCACASAPASAFVPAPSPAAAPRAVVIEAVSGPRCPPARPWARADVLSACVHALRRAGGASSVGGRVRLAWCGVLHADVFAGLRRRVGVGRYVLVTIPYWEWQDHASKGQAACVAYLAV